MERVTNGFIRMTMAQFSQCVESIVTRMTGNPNFPDQQTGMPAISAEADRFYVLAERALHRDKLVILQRNACRKKLIGLLHEMGFQVSSVAKGNVEVLASSGFPYTQPRKPFPPLVKPALPILSLGAGDGVLECRVASQPGRTSTNYYITADETLLKATGSAGWDVYSSSRVRQTFTGLVSGQRYYVRVGFVGVRGQELLSDVASYIPQ